MKHSDLTEDEKTFIAYMEKAQAQNPALYLAVIAIGSAAGAAKDIDWAEGHTRGSFKRAVKLLRGMQKEAPQCAAVYEGAIMYIRAEWLHREVGAAVCSSVAVGSEVLA